MSYLRDDADLTKDFMVSSMDMHDEIDAAMYRDMIRAHACANMGLDRVLFNGYVDNAWWWDSLRVISLLQINQL